MTAPTLGGGGFELVFHPSARDELLHLSAPGDKRFERAFDGLQADPFRRRPGVDIQKLADAGSGAWLGRLRVGDLRACFVVEKAERRVLVLTVERRSQRYDRILATALARLRNLGGGRR
ncbi:MAG TPA: type II toxin-antitoxin system RelE/ParE family toxin [Candidatus Thermoplasmatota archaeon]|nr:type II toxin-antitoxin system RelE/ParE family toxin [Candidatus Thermoplasmatota archaeon]